MRQLQARHASWKRELQTHEERQPHTLPLTRSESSRLQGLEISGKDSQLTVHIHNDIKPHVQGRKTHLWFPLE